MSFSSSLALGANQTLSNAAAHHYLKTLDPEFNKIIEPKSPKETFSEQVLCRYLDFVQDYG